MRALFRPCAAVLAGLLATFVAAGEPAAETLTIGPFEAPDNLASPAECLRLLLENERGNATGFLSSRVGLSAGESDFFVTGKLELVGNYMVATVNVAPKGTSAGKATTFKQRALRGQVALLARVVAEGIEKDTEFALGSIASLPLADVEPFASARRLYDRGDYQQAAVALSAGNRPASRAFAGAKRITREVLDNAEVPVVDRLAVASAFDLYDDATSLIAQLPEKEQGKWKDLFDARRKLVSYDVDGALPGLTKASKGGSVEAKIGLAKIAKMKKDKKAQLKALDTLLSTDPPDPAAAAYIADLPPGEVPPELAPQIAEMAEKLREEHPALAAQLALQGGGQALEGGDAYYLTPQDAMRAAEMITADGGDPTVQETQMLVDLNVAAGNLDAASELAAAGLVLAPDDPTLMAQQGNLNMDLAAIDSMLGIEDVGGGQMTLAEANKLMAGVAPKGKGKGKGKTPGGPKANKDDGPKTSKAKLESAFEEAEEEGEPLPWELIGALAAVMLLLFIVNRIRSTGSIVVKVKVDKTNKDYLNLKLDKGAKPPKIGKPKDWVDLLKVQGSTVKGNVVQYVSGEHRFARVGAGKKYIHLYGVVVEEGEMYPTFRTREVIVEKNKTTTITIDLVRKEAEFRVIVSGEKGLIQGAKVWIGDDDVRAVMSDKDGTAVVTAPPGEHVIHVSYKNDKISQEVRATNPTRQTIDLNIERQKRMNKLADGIAIDFGSPDDDVPDEYREAAATVMESTPTSEPQADDFGISIGGDFGDDAGSIPLDDEKGGL